MRIFILEDDEERISLFMEAGKAHSLTIARFEEEAEEMFLDRDAEFDLLLLDHDLDGEVYVDSSNPNTGAEFCRWLSTQEGLSKQTLIVIHSYNEDGARNMGNILHKAGFRLAMKLPFGPTLLSYLSTFGEALWP